MAGPHEESRLAAGPGQRYRADPLVRATFAFPQTIIDPAIRWGRQLKHVICKSPGIVLRVAAFSRTSHVIWWLTPAKGKTVILAKGAERPKSAFLGQYDLFYTCEIVYYSREGSGVPILKECSPLKPRSSLRDDWRAAVCASYLCALVSGASVAGSQQTDFYHLLDQGLDNLCRQGASRLLLRWFELRLMGVAGLSPTLSRCAACHRAVPAASAPVVAYSRGGVICRKCAMGLEDVVSPIRLDVLAVLRHWQACETPEAARRVVCSKVQEQDIDVAVRSFLRHHLDSASTAATIAFDLLRQDGESGVQQ